MISDELLGKVKEINELASRITPTKDGQNDYILHSMVDHAAEINELFKENNTHWATETGDLLVHCIRLLMINGYDVNKLLETIPERFVKKIKMAINEQNAPHMRRD